VMSRYGFLLTRVMIGIGGGLMVFYALQAGFLEGKFLPDLSHLDTQVSSADHAMLVLWCFLAGFSERFVPGLLSRMAPADEHKPEPAPDPSDAPESESTPPAAPLTPGARVAGATE
jgi:hypothetical protein